jgi:hypothetical protein
MNELTKIKLKSLKEQLAHVTNQIEELNSTCTHPNVDKKHRGDTGNYDPSADSYWIEYKCPDCGKFWTETQ